MQAIEHLFPFNPAATVERLQAVLADLKGAQAGPVLRYDKGRSGAMAHFTLSVGTLTGFVSLWRDPDDRNLVALNCQKFLDSSAQPDPHSTAGRDLALQLIAITQAAQIDTLYTEAKAIGLYTSATYGPRPYGDLLAYIEQNIVNYVAHDPLAQDKVMQRLDWLKRTTKSWRQEHGTELWRQPNNLKDVIDHLNQPITEGQYRDYGTIGHYVLSHCTGTHHLQWRQEELNRALERASRPLSRDTLDPRGFGLS